jgi:hypothetical protein
MDRILDKAFRRAGACMMFAALMVVAMMSIASRPSSSDPEVMLLAGICGLVLLTGLAAFLVGFISGLIRLDREEG